MYPPELTAPMRAELTSVGVQELTTAQAVEDVLAKGDTTFVLVNSVCGCAAGGARPGVAMALAEDGNKPANVTTVFAGVDREATDAARGHMLGFPPSSPSMALFKDGEVVWMLHRHQIEGTHPQQIAEAISSAFAEFC